MTEEAPTGVCATTLVVVDTVVEFPVQAHVASVMGMWVVYEIYTFAALLAQMASASFWVGRERGGRGRHGGHQLCEVGTATQDGLQRLASGVEVEHAQNDAHNPGYSAYH